MATVMVEAPAKRSKPPVRRGPAKQLPWSALIVNPSIPDGADDGRIAEHNALVASLERQWAETGQVEVDPREMGWDDIVFERNQRRTTTLRVLQEAVTAADACGDLWRSRSQQWMEHHRALIDEEAKTRKGLVKHLKAMGHSDEDYASTRRLRAAIMASPAVVKFREQQRQAMAAANQKWATKADADLFLAELTKLVNRWRSE